MENSNLIIILIVVVIVMRDGLIINTNNTYCNTKLLHNVTITLHDVHIFVRIKMYIQMHH